ncbi:MAG: hypothetical protein KC589_00055 [Nanoarchaeota archaeon]|nr:hypothetical protein [Nanoarchaeota archaeon]MCA9495312.1 hypothetical protein [Nanoarchaeota archaeon]
MYKKSQIRFLLSIFLLLLFFSALIYSFAGGDGSGGNPYQIENCTQLQNVSSNLTAHYILNNNINCLNFDYGDGMGFMPIGKNLSNYFNGSFNGNSYEIQNLLINRSSLIYVGLFGVNFGNISNLGIRTANIYGDVGVGILVGLNMLNSNINNSYTTGDVNGTTYVGGLAGYSNGVIDNTYAIGNVKGDLNRVGGLVGLNRYFIYKSYSITNVSGFNDVGGLVGYLLGGLIDNSYSINGSIEGSSGVGGLVGTTNGFIFYSFSTNKVNFSGGSGGGLVGFNSGTTNYSYWDNESSQINISAKGIGKKTLEMYNQSTYIGWNTSIWSFTNTSYPQLRWTILSQSINSSSLNSNTKFPNQGFGSIMIGVILIIINFIFN